MDAFASSAKQILRVLVDTNSYHPLRQQLRPEIRHHYAMEFGPRRWPHLFQRLPAGQRHLLANQRVAQ